MKTPVASLSLPGMESADADRAQAAAIAQGEQLTQASLEPAPPRPGKEN